jgi:flagellar biosynthetic protein FliQ
MNTDQVMDIMRELLWMACLVAGPLMLSGLVMGVIMGILQSATQIQEATLAFVPKLVVVALAMVMGGPWAIDKLVDYTGGVLQQLATIAPRGRG